MKGNLAVLMPALSESGPIDGDGEDGNGPMGLEITIQSVDNGYVLMTNDGENITQKVFLYKDNTEAGPRALIETIILELGLVDRVKISK